MQVIQNWADLQGKIQGVEKNPALPDYALAKLEVTNVEPVEGFPNLFSWAQGKTILVNVPVGTQLSAGDQVSWRVRKAGQKDSFLHPDAFRKSLQK